MKTDNIALLEEIIQRRRLEPVLLDCRGRYIAIMNQDPVPEGASPLSNRLSYSPEANQTKHSPSSTPNIFQVRKAPAEVLLQLLVSPGVLEMHLDYLPAQGQDQS
jgi:hypothetical protein